MSGVDNRIVTMKFDNKEFETNAKTSMSTLQKIKESMDFGKVAGGTIRALGMIEGALSKIGLKTPFAPMIKAANTGLAGLSTVLDKVGVKNPFANAANGAADMARAAQVAGGPSGMGVLEGGVTAVSAKFVALSTIAITALSNITNRAINAGTAFAKSFTVAPILQGLDEYQTKLQSIQTIQANTDRPLPEITKALQELNTYSDQTIYNFGEMAKNVGTFTAAGVDLKTSVASIQGIANIAALSGSSSQQAATAMYQLSQAISSGRVGLQDWNSVVNAGMGGKKLQNALAQTAVAMGKIDKASVKLVGPMKKLTINGESFRESIMAKPGQESWLSSDILVNTLASLDGRFSKSYQLSLLNSDGTKKYTAAQVESNIALARTNLEKKNGVKFTNEQFAALKTMADSATSAAQDVKTLGQVFDIAKETIGSGWSASFENIFGNLKESKLLFTGMSKGLNALINQNALTRNTMLAEWKKEGGRTALIDGLKNAWQAFYGIIQAVGKGLREVFPKKTAGDLVSMSKSFKELTERLKPSEKTLANITSIAKGFFSIFSIGKTILSGAVDMFKRLFTSMGGGQGNFLSFAAGIGDSISRFDEFLKTSGIVEAFFDSLGKILSVPLSLLKGVASAIGALFSGFDDGAASKLGNKVDDIGNRLSGLQVVGNHIKNFFIKIGDLFGKVGETIGGALVGIGDTIAKMFTPETFSQTLDVVNTSLLGALVLLVKKFFDKGFTIDLGGGLFEGIKDTLGEVTKGFTLMQQNLKANILLKLAAAIGVMALALLVLSGIDPGSLTKALAAMSGGFAVLITAMGALLKVMGPAGIVQLYVITAGMTKMAFSILLLAFALKIMSKIEFADMVRGLVGLGAALFIVSKAILPLAAGSKGMAKASTSLILVGIALNILAVALKIFATMSWGEMIKGLAGMTGVLISLAIGLKLMPEMKAEALGLIALGVAINLIAIALKVFATMSLKEMGKGLLALAGSLVIIAGAIRLMPKTMILQAAALVVVAGALNVLAGALKIMATMGWDDIGRGLTVLGGSMLILAAALKIIGPTAALGAVGIFITASALGVLAPILLAFGAMKLSTIAKSLGVLAGIFIILGVAANTIGPGILVLGAGIALVGAGLALMGAGALLAATAFGIVVAAGAAGIQILTGLLAAVIAAIPPAIAALANGFIQFVVLVGQAAPQIAASAGAIMTALLNTIITNAPKVAQAGLAMLNAFLRVLIVAIPRIANAGYRIMIGLLGAIAKNIPQLADKATSVITTFMAALGRNIPKIADSGAKMIIKVMEGVAKAIRENSEAMGKAGADIGIAIVEGIVKGLKGAGGAIKDKIVSLAKDAWNGVKNFLGIGGPSKLFMKDVGARIPQGMAMGVDSGRKEVIGEIVDLGKVSVSKMSQAMKGVNDAFMLDSNLNQPTIAPVLDLSGVTREAGKMSSILANAPVMATVSYQQAADISASTQTSNGGGGGNDVPPPADSGAPNVALTLELHSPKPIDSVDSYRAGKTLISLAKEALS